MYNIIGIVVVILLSPILVPLGLYIGLMYNWQDTVPSDEDLNYKPKKLD